MPRRGIGKPRNDWNQGGGGGGHSQMSHYSGGSYSDEHDDRQRKPATQRRVSFKTSKFIPNARSKRRNELAIAAHIEDDDIMGEYSGNHGIDGGPSSGGNYRHHQGGNKSFRSDKGRRKGSPLPRMKFISGGVASGKRILRINTIGWYHVSIPYGQKYQKEDIIRNILNATLPEIFIPLYWRQEKNHIEFYVDDFKMAEILLATDLKVQMPDGFFLAIKVRSGLPPANVDEQFKERLKLVMAKRYNAQTKALDLSKFHADPDFKDIFCGLCHSSVLTAAIEIIAKNIPDLEALNLNNNRIQHLDSFRNVAEKIPNLKVLYLGDNSIHSMGSLSVFNAIPIIELVISNNPIRKRYKDTKQFISDIRRKFPKLIKLDEQNLDPLISFDVLEITTLPPPVASFFCNSNGVDIIREFLKQYFLIYDSDSRQPLLEAYHENAMISLVCPSQVSGQGRLSYYWPYNRNLLRGGYEQESKLRLIKNGRLPVVSFLSELPKTQHDLMSFSVDLSLFLPNLISFTVAGLFKENSNDSSSKEIRSFQRLIVIIPGTNGGFMIRNEMIFISNATPIQVRTAFKQPQQQTATVTSLQQRIQPNITPQPMPSTSQLQMTPGPAVMPPTAPDDATKLQMIQAMSAQSNMNLEWSKKCLDETNWDYAHAAYVFDKLLKENKIPPEAFNK